MLICSDSLSVHMSILCVFGLPNFPSVLLHLSNVSKSYLRKLAHLVGIRILGDVRTLHYVYVTDKIEEKFTFQKEVNKFGHCQ